MPPILTQGKHDFSDPLCAHYAPSMRPLCALHAPSMRPLCALYAPSIRRPFSIYIGTTPWDNSIGMVMLLLLYVHHGKVARATLHFCRACVTQA